MDAELDPDPLLLGNIDGHESFMNGSGSEKR